MRVLPDHPLKRPILLFCVSLVICFVFMVWGREQRKHAAVDLETVQRRIPFSQAGAIAPSAAVLDSLEQANQILSRRNASLDAQLFEPGARHRFSGDSTAAYFELAGFIEEINQVLVTEGIALNEKERFGFSQFERQGPVPEVLDAVMAQKTAAELVLRILSESRPVSLLWLKRELIDGVMQEPSVLQQAAGSSSTSRTGYADTIAAGEKLDGLESYSMELSFEGYTESLRLFLKGLLSASLPVLVNDLRVQALDRYELSEGAPPVRESSNPFEVLSSRNGEGLEDRPVPIIRNNLSSFSMQLEVFLGEEANAGS